MSTPRQFYRNIYFLSTGDSLNSTTASVIVTGGLSIQKNTNILGNLTVSNVTSTGLTTGNINFTGNLYQNNVPYIGSQWTGTSGSLYYGTGGSFVGINTTSPSFALDVNGNARTLGLTTGNINFTGNLYQNGSLYIGSQWTGSTGTLLYYGSGGAMIGINTSTPSYTLDVNGNARTLGFTTGNIQSTGLTTGNIQSTGLTTGNIQSTGLTTGNIQSTSLITGNITSTNITTSNFVATTSTVPNVIHTNITTTSLLVTGSLIGTFNSNTLGNLYTTGGNIGINTVSPVYPLHVTGNIYAGPSVYSGSSINLLGLYTKGVFNSNINGLPATSGTVGNAIALRVRGGDDASMDFGVNSGNGSWIQTTNWASGYNNNYPLLLNPNGGNVGINTASPSYTLDIGGSLRANILTSTSFSPAHTLINTGTSHPSVLSLLTPNITIGNYNTTFFGQSMSLGNSGQLNFIYNGNNNTGNSLSLSFWGGPLFLFLNNNGNIGINTSSPVYPLHVTGNIYAGPSTYTNPGFGTINTIGLYTKGVFNSNVNGFPATSGTVGNAIALRVRGGDDAVMDFGVNSVNASWIQSTNFAGYNSNYPLILNPNGGNVGINTTSPTFALDVSGNIRSNTSGTSIFGNSTGSAIVDLIGGAGSRTVLYALNDGNSYLQYNNNMYINKFASGGVPFCIQGSSGNVGINTISPQFTLDVAGNMRASSTITQSGGGRDASFVAIASAGQQAGIALDSTSGGGHRYNIYSDPSSKQLQFFNVTTTNPSLNLDSRGNLGIGIANPVYTLDVNGSARIFGSINMSSSYTSTSGGNIFANYLGYNYGSGIVCNGFTMPSPYFMTTQYQSSTGLDSVYLYTPGTGNNSVKISMLHNGNVGINTTSPAYALDVSGTLRTTSQTGQTTNFSGQASYVITVDLSTYQMVEIILRQSYTVNNVNCNIRYNGTSTFAEYGAIFLKYSALTSPFTDTSGILFQNIETGVNDSFAIIKVCKGTSGGRNTIDIRGSYCWAGFGQTRVDATANINFTLPGSINISVPSGTMSGSYTIRNIL